MVNTKEFSTKLKRIYEMMQREGIDACILKKQENFLWLTGGGKNYLAHGELGLCSLVISKKGLYAITNNIEAPRIREEERIEDFGFELLYDVWHNETFETDIIKKLFPNEKIGFDYPHPLGINIADSVKKLRFSLTEEEVEKYIEGGKIVSTAVEEIAAAINPGDTEIEIVGRIWGLSCKLGLEPMMIFCASDERFYKFRHPIPTAKKVEERVQFGGNIRYKGLTICLARYVNFVPVTKALEKQYRDNAEIDCTMIAGTIPGKSYQHPFLAGKKAYEERGYAEEFNLQHLGGPIGYLVRDMRIGFNHHDIIPENQAFCWNPSIAGTMSEDTIIATKDGPVFVTKPIIYPTINVTVGGVNYSRAAILEKC